jgi:D-alanyl-D-alanine carboxypeptidase/D-alanyl-D-alanine-endopeptidase (penicillin-binding protein 4)
MSGHRKYSSRVASRLTLTVLLISALLLAACSSGGSSGNGPSTPDPVGSLPSAVQTIMSKPAYAAARWGYLITNQKNGKVLYSYNADQLAFTASTMKLFTISGLFAAYGPTSKLTTPVYTQGSVVGGVLTGNLDLVASGDLTLGGREAAQGKAVNAFSTTKIDHVYGDLAPNGAVPPGDPLAGLNSLAKQVAAKGIHQIKGDVIIDDRLWDPYTGQEGPVPPIYVNDNVLDLTVTPGAVGQPATVVTTPVTKAFNIDSTVKTVSGSASAISVAADETNPKLLHLTGTIGSSAGPRLTIHRIKDAATWARTLFVEALARAGVSVSTAASSDNDTAALPAKGSYTPAQQAAAYQSTPISALGTLVMETSYNTGANAFLCLIAVKAGSSDCEDGLKTIRTLINKAGLNSNDVVLVDGQGADPASITPTQMVKWLQFIQTQPWGAALKATLPILGETGTLAAAGLQSPARGKIAAKTGTSAAIDPATGRGLFNVQSLAGFMTAANGDPLVFDLWVSGATFPTPGDGVGPIGDDVGNVAAAFQQAVK